MPPPADNHRPDVTDTLSEGCQRRLQHAMDQARGIAADADLDADQRRRLLLRRLALSLAPAQLQRATAYCEEVARTAARVAACMRLGPQAQHHARLVCLLHDISAIVYHEELLARHSAAQPELLHQAPALSALICQALGIDQSTCRAVATHLDRFDSTQDLHQSARIVAVARVLVTHTSPAARTPMQALTEALAHLRRGRGTSYDPRAVIAAHMLPPIVLPHTAAA